MQSLYATRSLAHHEGIQILNRHFGEIIDALILFEEEPEENYVTRQEANCSSSTETTFNRIFCSQNIYYNWL